MIQRGLGNRRMEDVPAVFEILVEEVSGDDLEALANAVREAAASSERSATLFDELESRTAVGAEGTRRGHLRSLPAGYDSEG